MAVSTTHRPPLRRKGHVGAAVAALAYAGAIVAGVAVVQSALAGRHGDVAGVAVERVTPSDTVGLRASERLALQARASRAQQGVFALEAANGATGSAFIAWTEDGRTYLVTARDLVGAALADGDRRVFLRRGDRVWGGRVWGVHASSGLAVVRMDGRLAEPLWQQPRRSERLVAGARVAVLPGGPASPIAEGSVARVAGRRARVSAPADELALGAPVVVASGRVAGVVVAASGRSYRVVAIERACAALRVCS